MNRLLVIEETQCQAALWLFIFYLFFFNLIFISDATSGAKLYISESDTTRVGLKSVCKRWYLGSSFYVSTRFPMVVFTVFKMFLETTPNPHPYCQSIFSYVPNTRILPK